MNYEGRIVNSEARGNRRSPLRQQLKPVAGVRGDKLSEGWYGVQLRRMLQRRYVQFSLPSGNSQVVVRLQIQPQFR
jgi:hypothetical protein